jgi:hypothetical protein
LGHKSQFDHIFSRRRREKIFVKLTFFRAHPPVVRPWSLIHNQFSLQLLRPVVVDNFGTKVDFDRLLKLLNQLLHDWQDRQPEFPDLDLDYQHRRREVRESQNRVQIRQVELRQPDREKILHQAGWQIVTKKSFKILFPTFFSNLAQLCDTLASKKEIIFIKNDKSVIKHETRLKILPVLTGEPSLLLVC